jgi:cytochrome c6
MKSICTGMLVALVVLGLAVLTSPSASFGDDSAGLYKSKCAMCHGADGKGETPAGKSMKVKDFASDDVKSMSDADLSDAIAKGKGKMPPFKTLSADQVKGLVEYVRAFAKK